MIKLKLGIFYILAILITGCSGKADVTEMEYSSINNPEWGSLQKSETPPFRFELIDSILIETPNDEIIGGISSLLTDKNGHIYFMDRQQSKLISLAADGSFRWMTGQEGKGPGDFENPFGVVSDGNTLIVANIQGSRLDRFDFNGNFLSSQSLNNEIGFSNIIGVTEDKYLVLTTPFWGSFGKKVHVVEATEDSINIVHQFEVDQSGGLEISEGLSSSSTFTVYNDKIFAGSVTDYSIKTYNLQGQLEQTINRDFDKIVRPGFSDSGNFRSIRNFGGVDAPVTLPNGYSIVNSHWPTNVSDPDEYMVKNQGSSDEVIFRNSLDYYSPDGTLLYSQEHDGYFPELGAISHVDEDGIIYVSSTNPSAVIHRYSISIAGI